MAFYSDAYEIADLLDKWNHQGPPNMTAMNDLFARDPEAAKYIGLRSKTLVHLCLDYYAYHRLDLLKFFIEHNPKALFHPDDDGLLPLHAALLSAENNNLNAITLILESSGPEILIYQDLHGALPLHYACESKFSRTIPILQLLIDPFPDALQHPDNTGRYPLHHALEQESHLMECIPQPDAIEFLIEKCPTVLHESIPDKNGQLPLHRAVQFHSTHPRTVSILADRFPRALRIQDKKGRTPLCIACVEPHVSLSVVHALVRQWPEQITTQASTIFTLEYNGEMLISCMASETASLDTIHAWTKVNGIEVTDGDSHGRLPLHYAAVSKSNQAMDIVQHLIELHPDALSKPDVHGRIPLHYAAISQSKYGSKVLQLLLEQYPKGLTVKDCDGRLPWHYAEFADAKRGELLLDRTIEADPDLDYYLVPDEVRWDIVQVCPLLD